MDNHSTSTHHFAVLGAGIVGLSTALRLLRLQQRVTILSASWPGCTTNPYYTSMYSGAQWRSNPSLTDLVQQRWDKSTLLHWRYLCASGLTPEVCGLELRQGLFVWDLPGPQGRKEGWQVNDEHWWSQRQTGEDGEELIRVDAMEKEEREHSGWGAGFKYETIVVNPVLHCEWLLGECEKLGVMKKSMRVTTLTEVFDEMPDVSGLVNCAGLEAGRLTGDENCFSTKGQTLLVRGRADRVVTRRREEGNEAWEALVIPRPGKENVTLLGGCKWPGDSSTEPDMRMTELIQERCKPLAPELLNDKGDFDLVATLVGLRPSRKGGPRIELERFDGHLVCHNYGHHSAGFEGSVGAAEAAAALLLGALDKPEK